MNLSFLEKYNINLTKFITEIAILLLGNALFAFFVITVLTPNKVVTGGISGLSVGLLPVLEYFNISQQFFISMGFIFCFFLGAIFLDFDYTLKCLFSTIVFPIFTSVFQGLKFQSFHNTLVGVLFSAVMVGIGLGLIFRIKGNTGGMDIPTLILAKYSKLSVGVCVIIVDSMTIMIGLYTLGLESVVLGVIHTYVCGVVIDKVVEWDFSQVSCRLVTVISAQSNAILHQITESGLEIMDSKFDDQILCRSDQHHAIKVLIDSKNYQELVKICEDIDPECVIIAHTTKRTPIRRTKGLL